MSPGVVQIDGDVDLKVSNDFRGYNVEVHGTRRGVGACQSAESDRVVSMRAGLPSSCCLPRPSENTPYVGFNCTTQGIFLQIRADNYTEDTMNCVVSTAQ